MKRRLCLWMLLMLCLFVLPCSAVSTADAPSTVVVVMGPTSEPEAGFDPAFGWGAGEHVHEPLIQSTLTVTTKDLGIAYDLATGMQASEDGLTWTVTIRSDAVFSDGVPLTARDVAFTYNTVKATTSVSDFTMLEKAEAVDDTTVRFLLNRPYAIWPYTMASIGIVPEHAYGPGYGQQPIGSGRYLLAQWDRGQQVILEANPLYYGAAPKMQRVVILFMEEDTAYLAALSGQVDLAYTAATYAAHDIPGYRLLRCESVDNRGLNLPTLPDDGQIGNDVTADPAIRQAIQLGLDRQTLIDHVLGGFGTPAYSVCDKLPWYSEANDVDCDPSKAAALLDDAGWLPQGDGIRAKDGLRAAFTLMYPAGDSVRQALAAEVAGQLSALGIEVAVEGVGWDVAYQRAMRDPLLWGWGAHTPMELYNLYHSTAKTGLAAYTPYASATVDAYMDAALEASDLEESYALWQQAQWDGQGGTTEDLPWVWLCNLEHLYFAKNGLSVADQIIHPHGHGWSVVNNVDQWSWE